MNNCIECGARCEKDFCSPQCEDLFTYGPSTPPGWCLVEVPINHIVGKGDSKHKYGGRL